MPKNTKQRLLMTIKTLTEQGSVSRELDKNLKEKNALK